MKDWKIFVTAGRAIFTLRDKNSGLRYTFKVSKKDQIFFVSVLTGSDNINNYTYLGLINDRGEFVETHKTKINKSRTGNAFTWFKRLWEVCNSDEELAPNMEFYHAGHCGRCGKLLTVPSSIESGFGPECADVIGILKCRSINEEIYESNSKELKKLLRLHRKMNAE